MRCFFLTGKHKENKSHLCFHLAQFGGLNGEILSIYRNSSLSNFLCCACALFYQFLPASVKETVLFLFASFLRITASYYRAQDRCDIFSFISKVLN